MSPLAPAGTAGPPRGARGLADLVVARPGLVQAPVLRFILGPADRPLVQAGQTVFAGEPLLERVADAALADVDLAGEAAPPAGSPMGPEVSGEVPVALRRVEGHGRVLFTTAAGHLQVAVGAHAATVASPVAGVVSAVEAGSISLAARGEGLPGTLAAGEGTRGQLTVQVAGPADELPPSAIDVGSAGAILVAGARIDLEALGRARAMGVRGIVVGGLVSRDLRGFRASEMRQRAALHGGPPFAVLVLEGFGKRAIASSTWDRLQALAGREVAISTDPPLLVLPDGVDLPRPPAGRVRICGGPDAGREATFLKPLGRYRWLHGLEGAAGLVRLDPLEADGPDLERVVALGDLEALA